MQQDSIVISLRSSIPYPRPKCCWYYLAQLLIVETVQNLGGLPAVSLGRRLGRAQGSRGDQGREDLPDLFSPHVLDGLIRQIRAFRAFWPRSWRAATT
jgi:hypothetical protein